MYDLKAMRSAPVRAAAAVLAGGAIGTASRLAATGDAGRGVVALFVAFGVGSCVAGAWNAGADSLLTRLRCGALVAATAFAAAWAAGAAAGSPSLFGAAAVVAGAAVLACGVASLARALGVGRAHATFAGAAVPVALAALVFVADPFVEWRGSSTAEAPGRAAAVIDVTPLASIAADAGADWQRSKWMYHGPDAGAPGLSVIGRYYWSRPASPWAWALAAAACGFAALAAARRSSNMAP